jgi:hypothetical protein
VTVKLTTDPERGIATARCLDCKTGYRVVTGFIYRDGDAFAVHKSALHRHGGQREAWIDVTFGPWETDVSDDRVTFGCRIGPFGEAGANAAALVPGAAAYSEAGLFGRKLSRNEALEHPSLSDFWSVVDFLVEHDADIAGHLA